MQQLPVDPWKKILSLHRTQNLIRFDGMYTWCDYQLNNLGVLIQLWEIQYDFSQTTVYTLPLFFPLLFPLLSCLKWLPVFPSLLCLSGLVSLQQPALCPTSSVSLTLGPSLFVTHHLSSSAPSMTSLHCCPVKRSSYPGETWSCSALWQRRKGVCNLLSYPTVIICFHSASNM